MSVAVALRQVVSERAQRAVRAAPAVLLLGAPVLGLVYLLTHPALDPRYEAHVAHFYVVTFVALLGFAISAVVTVGSGRLREARAFFLNLGFLSISGIFLVHAVTTPGVLMGVNPSVGLAARLSLFAGSVAFALSVVRWSERANRWIAARWRRLFVALFALWLAFAAVAVLVPELLVRPVARMDHAALLAGPAPRGGFGDYGGDMAADAMAGAAVATISVAPAPAPPAGPLSSSSAMAVATILLFAFAAGRYLREYRLSALPAHGTLVAGIVLLAEAQLAMWLAPTWALSWWGYHGLMLAGFLASMAGFGLSYTRSGSLAGVVETLFLTDTIERIESSYNEAIFALVAAVEARDRYTKGHSARVSQMAVLVGETLRLPGAQLRSLGRGGLIHDVGKLAIPDAILSKPGRLTAAEYEIVRQHPVRGYEVIRSVASLRDELPGVLHHHEWYDGAGYPAGLAGEQIPLAARILAVADVYDALTSERPYRQALPADGAVAHLRQMAGTQFDPRVVEALVRIEPAWRERRRRPVL